ncbi:MAG: insulinase family protein [Chitinophagaceae bacterium]|nr:MAG: insulinase family protein [Chitinophagaceae bacterium]
MHTFKKILAPAFSLFLLNTTIAQTKNFGIRYEKFVLENGLEVILHEDHSDPIVAVSTNRKLIPEWGGNRNGGTWNDGTIYYEVIPKDAFEKILWIDSDRLGFMINTVTKDALEKEIQVVKNEKRQNYDNVPYGNTNEVIVSNLYPKGHPYNWTVIGLLPDLQAATLEDVKEFYEKYYGAGNATLVIAGDIDIAKTKERVKVWFGEIRKEPAVEALKPQPAKLDAVKSFYYEDNFAKLPELTMVYPTVELYHKDSYALNVLAELLTGSKNSPFYKTIVQNKKLAPNAAAYNESKEIAGEFQITVRANADTKLDDVKTAIDEAFRLFETQGISDKEMQRIKAKLETGLYQGIEDVLDKAQRLGQDNEFKGDPGYITKEAAILQSITKDDVKRVYEKYIKNKPYLATSFVPKGKKDLAMNNATEAKVWVEQVVAGVQNENVQQGADAVFEKTKTKHDRSEPAFGEMPLFKMPAVWNASLSNGIKVLGLESNETPLVNFEIVLKGGHWADPLDKSGVASLLASMLMQGTASKTPAELEEAIDLLGSSINVSSGNEEMRIRATCLQRNYEPTLALVQEILLQPRWDKAEFDRLYKALVTNLKGREANASSLASINFNKLIYGDQHILGYPASGTLQSVANISLEDLKTYYGKYFSPSISNFNVAGDIKKERVIKTLAGLEKDWKASAVSLPNYTIPAQNNGGSVYFIDMPDSKQSVIFLGKLALSAKDAASEKLEFANEVLGVGSSGRLTQVLRIGKGYTYGAGSGLIKQNEPGTFVATTNVRANATLPSLEIIRDMLKDYGTGFTDTEVDITKNKILKKNTLLYEGLGAKLGMLGEMSKYNKSMKYLEDKQNTLVNMKLSDFKDIIQQQMKEEDFVYVIVGDKATQLEEVKKLGKAKVVELDINGKTL